MDLHYERQLHLYLTAVARGFLAMTAASNIFYYKNTLNTNVLNKLL